MLCGALPEENKNRNLGRPPALKQLPLPAPQPAQQIDRLVGHPGQGSAPLSALRENGVDKGLHHQALELRAGGVLDIPGQVAGHLLDVLVVPPGDGGHLVRGRDRDAAVDNADPPLFALQLLVEAEEVAGKGQPVRDPVLGQKAVVKKAPVAAPGLSTGEHLSQLRLLHPGVGAGLHLRRRTIQPLAVYRTGELLLKPLQAEMRREGGQPVPPVEP